MLKGGFGKYLGNVNPNPESYSIVEKMAKDLGIQLEDLIGNKEAIGKIDLSLYISETVGLST